MCVRAYTQLLLLLLACCCCCCCCGDVCLRFVLVAVVDARNPRVALLCDSVNDTAAVRHNPYIFQPVPEAVAVLNCLDSVARGVCAFEAQKLCDELVRVHNLQQ
jgi:hypothetical protein